MNYIKIKNNTVIGKIANTRIITVNNEKHLIILVDADSVLYSIFITDRKFIDYKDSFTKGRAVHVIINFPFTITENLIIQTWAHKILIIR